MRMAVVVERGDGTPTGRARRKSARFCIAGILGGGALCVSTRRLRRKPALRCSLEGCDAGRWLELPAWMLDRVSCAPMRIEERPCVDVGALSALTAVLATTGRVARRPVVARSGFGRRMGLLQPESGRHPCHASAISAFTKDFSSISSVCRM